MKKWFARNPDKDPEAIRDAFMDRKGGLHLFFRRMNVKMQARFADLIDHDILPIAFIHGNPHLENYAITENGAAMVDFDRSRHGPYAYDICRFLASVMVWNRKPNLSAKLVDSFYHGYLDGLRKAVDSGEQDIDLRDCILEDWRKRLDKQKCRNKWAGRLEKFRTDPKDPMLQALLASYCENRCEPQLLTDYELSETACVPGTFGKHHYLFHLIPTRNSSDEPILIDIKEVYDEPDNRWYSNPFNHNGQRMAVAGELYAPGWELRPGWASYNGEQYWGRQISPGKAKLKKRLVKPEQKQACYTIGLQLGRAHGLSVANLNADALFEHFKENFSGFFKVSRIMAQELMDSYEHYNRRLSKRHYQLSKAG